MINGRASSSLRERSYISSFTTPDVRGVLYTCPPNCRSRMTLLFVTNSNGTTTVNIEWFRASDNTHYFILGGKNTSTGEFIQFSDSYIVLEPGDKIEITPSGNVSPVIDAFCTVEEYFSPAG